MVKVDVPIYKELSAKVIWEKVKNLPDVKDYFPDLKENELPDREFMWNILHTLKPRSTKTLIDKAMKNRGVDNEETKDNMVEIAPEFLEKLMDGAAQKVGRTKYRLLFHYLKSTNRILFLNKIFS